MKLQGFDMDKFEGCWSFREVVRGLLWLANQTKPGILNAVRAVASLSHAPKHLLWKAALSRSE